MNTEINNLQELKQFFADHLEFCGKVRRGKITDDYNVVVVFDDYWKGVNSAYINAYNAVNNLIKDKGGY